VTDGAWVTDDAWVSGDARVFGNASVTDGAWVTDDAWVFGNARVSGGYVGAGAQVFAPHHVQTFRDSLGVLWTVYRRRYGKKPRIMRGAVPAKYRDAPAIVRAIAKEVAA
jgi:carbonic anhydrase/acetyltransferase-like protein (isoleucine patch superfamily)